MTKSVFHFGNLTEKSDDCKGSDRFFVLVTCPQMSDITYMADVLQDRIKARLEALGKSASGASLEAGLGRSAITDILTGNSGSPRLITLEKVAKVLDCSLAYLIGATSEVGEWARLSTGRDDVQLQPIYADLEVGVFRSVGRHAWRFKDPAKVREEDVYPVFGDPAHPDWSPSLYRVVDDSMTAVGILKGDIVTAVQGSGEEVVLSQGLLVIVRRTFDTQDIEERTIRMVDLRPEVGQIGLVSRSAIDDFEPVIVDTEFAATHQQEFLENYFPTKDGTVWIDGLVVRISREIGSK